MVGSIPTGSLFRDLGTGVKTNPFALAIRLQLGKLGTSTKDEV